MRSRVTDALEFDFNDDAIPTGVEMLVRCAIES